MIENTEDTPQQNQGDEAPRLHREMSLVEAILFLESEPVDIATVAKRSNIAQNVVEQLLQQLQVKYNDPTHGIELIHLGGGFLLSPKEELWEHLRHHYGKRNENRLSKAAIETLSIIAYSQPITRSEIENFRGVNPDGMIRILLSRKLIKEVGRKDVPGKPALYGTTNEFLKIFKLGSISELPKLDENEQSRFELSR